MNILPRYGRPAGALMVLLALLVPGQVPSAEAAWRVPWQRFDYPLDDCVERRRDGSGYFRPEYGELVQRLDSETMDWLARTYPVLGWQDMDPRVFTPKRIPGTDTQWGFRYDTSRRNIRLEALFHFGPRAGNGTLIEDMMRLDGDRLITVNRGSRNISVIDVDEPDLAGVIEAPRGVQALEWSLKSGEIYVVEREALGMLVFSLGDLSVRDTLLLDFSPGAVSMSPDTRYLFFTDEENRRLARLDLASEQRETRYASLDISPPYLIAAEERSGNILVISRSEGRMRLIDTAGMRVAAQDNSLPGRLLAWHAPPGGETLLLAAGDCRSSAVYSIGLEDGRSIRAGRLASLGEAVLELGSSDDGGRVYAISRGTVYRLDPGSPGQVGTRRMNAVLTGLAAGEDGVYVAGGLSTVFRLDRKLERQLAATTVELGPRPLVAGEGRLYVANGLSNSLTILDSESLEEEISVLVGVLLGRMVFHNDRVVVNNCFRPNIMVLDPLTYRIEDIVPVGGAMFFNPDDASFAVFSDSSITSMPGTPSKLSLHNRLDMPGGVRLFAHTADPQVYLVADHDRYVTRAELDRGMRRGNIPLPLPAKGVFTVRGQAWVMAENELYNFPVSANAGITRTHSTRAFKLNVPLVAGDGFSSTRGSVLEYIEGPRLADFYTTMGEVTVMRNDADTLSTWVGTTHTAYVFDWANRGRQSSVPVRQPVLNVYIPEQSRNIYLATAAGVVLVDRESNFSYETIDAPGSFVYARADDLFVRDIDDPRTLIIANGYHSMVFERQELPLVPTDAASDGERLILLGSTEGSVAFYANLPEPSRMPRSSTREAWDTDADRRTGTHR